MLKSVVTGFLGLCAITALGSAPAAAWDCCDCAPGNGYGYSYGYYGVPPPRVYAYEPRVAYYRQGPVWSYSAAYYAPPPRAYSYVYVDRGPAYAVYPRYPRYRWYEGW